MTTTPGRTAEEIAYQLFYKWVVSGVPLGRISQPWLSGEIATALREYAKAEVEKASAEERETWGTVGGNAHILRQAESKGFAKALTQAAEVASTFDGGSIKPKYDWISTRAGIAQAILALRSSPAKEETGEVHPRIVCLCGSTRFMDAFFEAGWQFTLRGEIVLSVGVAKHLKTPDGGHAGEALGPEVCAKLDKLHLRKIDMCDHVFVLNVNGYIGESTRKEIEYAKKIGRPIGYMVPIKETGEGA